MEEIAHTVDNTNIIITQHVRRSTAIRHVQPSTPHQYPFQEYEPQPGMQYLEPSNLEVVQHRHGLSQNRTYEQPSLLPELKPRWDLSPEPPHAVSFSDLQAVSTSDLHTVPISDLHTVPVPVSNSSTPSQSSPEPDSQKIKPRIFGLKRKKFWVILSTSIFLFIAALAVGVGVGVARSQGSTTYVSAEISFFSLLHHTRKIHLYPTHRIHDAP